ncbi:MAG: hypothetical protein Q4F49_03160 [Pseudoxanthomonas suwonensis]|nr:hypothetical protein [Pseudoxanthomonas suwonensis]
MSTASARPSVRIPPLPATNNSGLRVLLAGLLLTMAACKPVAPEPATTQAPLPTVIAHGAPDPVQAVVLPTRLLRGNDYAGFSRASVPAETHAALDAAWRAGKTRWPLDELPFDERVPALLEALSATGAEPAMQRAFDRQFAGADRELHSAAEALGVFGVEYLRTGEGFSSAERAHYTQLVQAAAAWARGAPLGDKARAHAAVTRMVHAARGSGLVDADSFARFGMLDSLQRVGPVLAAAKATLLDYGLDLDASLDAMQVELVESDGDRALLRMHYPLGTRMIDARVHAVRVDGRWYLQDFLEHARAAAALAPADDPPAPAAPGSDGEQAEQPPPQEVASASA